LSRPFDLARYRRRPCGRRSCWNRAAALSFVLPKETIMADDKSNVGMQDRQRVAGGEEYEVDYFAKKHGLSADQVRDLIGRFGNDRATLEREAEKMSR
jgi:hypothetical protein